jgi:hypothetical protein
MAELAILLYYLFNLVFLWSFGLLLTVKSVKKRFDNVAYFGIAIIINGFFFFSKFFYNLLDIQAGKVSIPEIPYVLSIIPGIIFIKKTFHANKNRPIVILVWIIYAVSAVASISSGFMEELTTDNMVFRIVRYSADDLVVYPVVFTWNIVNGIRAYKQNATTTTRFVRLRFVYFALGHLAGIVTGVLDFLSGIVLPELYDIYAPFSVFCAVFYGLFMYLTWFPPAVLNKGAVDAIPRMAPAPLETGASAGKPGSAHEAGSTVDLSQKMRVIEHFGTILSRKIGKSPAACSGLLLVCIEDHLGKDSVFRMGIKDLEAVISNVLPGRLNTLGVAGAKEAVAALKEELSANVSLLTMSMF